MLKEMGGGLETARPMSSVIKTMKATGFTIAEFRPAVQPRRLLPHTPPTLRYDKL